MNRTHTLINCALFAFIVTAMFGIQVIDNKGYENDVAKEELAKQRQRERLEQVAAKVCEPNGSFTITEGTNQIVCKTHRNRKTGRVAQL